MHALATHPSPSQLHEDSGSRPRAIIAPDCAGQNFYAIDRGLRDLLPLYLHAG